MSEDTVTKPGKRTSLSGIRRKHPLRIKRLDDDYFFRNVASSLTEFGERNEDHIVSINVTTSNSIEFQYTTPTIIKQDLTDFLNGTFDFEPIYRKPDSEGNVMMAGMMTASFPVTLVEMLFPDLIDPKHQIRFTDSQIIGEKGSYSSIDMKIRKYIQGGKEKISIMANCYKNGVKPHVNDENRDVKKRGNVFVGINGTIPRANDPDTRIYIPLEDEIFDLFYGSRAFDTDYVEGRLGFFKTRGYLLSLVPGQLAEAGKRIGLKEGDYGMQTLDFKGRGINSNDFDINVHFNEKRVKKFKENGRRYLKPSVVITAGGYEIATGDATIITQKKDTGAKSD